MPRDNEYRRTPPIQEWIASYLFDRAAGNKSPRTLSFYAEKLNKFATYCDAANIGDVDEITPDTLRRFLLWLESEGHNPGGVHAHYRSVKAFVRWWELETEPEGWRDPFRKIQAPKVTTPILPPVPLADVNAMVQACPKSWHGQRDAAMLLGLVDTGARATEFLSLNVEDVNLRTGAVQIVSGKGGKPRTVFVGKTARRALRKYLSTRRTGPLWIKQDGDRLSYSGLRSMLRNKAQAAKVGHCTPHSFRRAFAVNMLRAGVDLETLRRLMGHSDLSVLYRYLDLLDSDLQRAHAHASPADQLRKLTNRR